MNIIAICIRSIAFLGFGFLLLTSISWVKDLISFAFCIFGNCGAYSWAHYLGKASVPIFIFGLLYMLLKISNKFR